MCIMQPIDRQNNNYAETYKRIAPASVHSVIKNYAETSTRIAAPASVQLAQKNYAEAYRKISASATSTCQKGPPAKLVKKNHAETSKKIAAPASVHLVQEALLLMLAVKISWRNRASVA